MSKQKSVIRSIVQCDEDLVETMCYKTSKDVSNGEFYTQYSFKLYIPAVLASIGWTKRMHRENIEENVAKTHFRVKFEFENAIFFAFWEIFELLNIEFFYVNRAREYVHNH